VGEGKMSKSKGNVIYADDLRSYFGRDAVRYIMLHEMPFSQDGTVTYELMVERINSDLANVLGNLVNRTIAMSNKYFDGIVENTLVNEAIDDELINLALSTPQKVEKKMDELRVQDSLDEIFTLLKRSNKYIDETMPWKLAQDESQHQRLKTVLYNLLEAIRIAAILLEPYLPETAVKILDQLNTKQRSYDTLSSFGQLEDGVKVTDKPEILFARLDEKEILKKIEEDQKPPVEKKDEKPGIDITDFGKVQLKVGTVIKSEKHPKADKLLVSQIDIGNETRQIVSGIATFISPEEFVGKKVVVVTNLKPAMIRGVESQGMILAGEDSNGLEVINVTKLANGSEIR
jgi:methionyl-tRNA synthetase